MLKAFDINGPKTAVYFSDRICEACLTEHNAEIGFSAAVRFPEFPDWFGPFFFHENEEVFMNERGEFVSPETQFPIRPTTPAELEEFKTFDDLLRNLKNKKALLLPLTQDLPIQKWEELMSHMRAAQKLISEVIIQAEGDKK